MSIQLIPAPDQLRDLAILRDLGKATLKKINDKLAGIEPATKPSEIEGAIQTVLPEQSNKVRTIMKLIMSFYALRRQRNLTVDELLQGLSSAIESFSEWTEEEISKWKELETHLPNFFSLPSVMSVVKMLDLSYDYSNLLQNSKILTDIRPIFNEDASNIEGSVISYTLRIYYNTRSISKNLSIALDKEDIIKLRNQCERALEKAKTAKKFMQENKIQKTFIAGEDED